MSFTEQVDLSVLLQNTAKPEMSYIDRSSTASLDLSKLDVCFGGFSPMALSDGNASTQQVLASEKRLRERREALKRAADIEAARASEERLFVDDNGTEWKYVVLDGDKVRVERCVNPPALLELPIEIEGLPVVALAPDACAYLDDVERVVCHDGILSIGFCAFRCCTHLKSIRFPKHVSTYDSHWVRSCNELEEVVLPGEVESIDARLFDTPNIRRLIIGHGLMGVAEGAFVKSKLESVEIDPENPFLSTDGRGIYTKDGEVLLALAVPSDSYEVQAGCRGIGKKAFAGLECLEKVSLPESIEALGGFALSRTSLSRFEAPHRLSVIGEKAFFNCGQLKEVELNEGLRYIGANAFTSTKIEALVLPASLEKIECPLALHTGLVFAGDDATLQIAEGSEHLKLDKQGGLYVMGDEGLHLFRMMDVAARSYSVNDDVVVIDPLAFANQTTLEEIFLPEGLQVIGAGAFKGCRALQTVNIPSTVRRIEDEAFLDTELARIELPAGLEYLGQNALVTYGAHHGDEAPSLTDVEVKGDQSYLYRAPSLLLERKGNGKSRVLLRIGQEEIVRIPAEVDEIAPYAFNGAKGIRELHLFDGITTVGMRGLAVGDLIELIHIDLMEPYEGHTSFDLRFPDTDRSAQQMMLSLSVPDFVNVPVIFEHYDGAIVNASSFDPQSRGRISVYDQATRIVERMLDPVYMSSVIRSMCERILTTNIEEICVELARHDDRKTLESLLDLGYLNEDNINQVIERIGSVQDAAMTGYLLEAKRMRFGQAAFDFDL